jgi:WhiB family transcriptional regulator, redox-sensing transcriptional regulator
MTSDKLLLNRITLDLHEAISDLDGVECEKVPEIFFPEDFGVGDSRLKQEAVETARAICFKCPVIDKCLKVGLFEEYGIWGGTTPEQRRRIRRYEQD